jgi:hypothetical protein
MNSPHLIETAAAARRADMLAAAEHARLARLARESRPRRAPAVRRSPVGWWTRARALRARPG